MKVRVTLKDPDTMHDAVEGAVARLPKPEDLCPQEWADVRDSRVCKVSDAISEKWMEYGEYLVVEFDTDAGTATVIPIGEV